MNNNPVRLAKMESPSMAERFEGFLMKHATFFLIILIIVLILLIVAVCVAITHGQIHPPAMVESGNYYYHLEDII